MFGKLVSISYVLNIIFQAFFTLLTPAGLGFLCSYLLVRFANTPSWVYAPFLTVGVLIGFVSMVRFILSAMASYERLERAREESRKKRSGTQAYPTRGESTSFEASDDGSDQPDKQKD